jgi:hypothetical protein
MKLGEYALEITLLKPLFYWRVIIIPELLEIASLGPWKDERVDVSLGEICDSFNQMRVTRSVQHFERLSFFFDSNVKPFAIHFFPQGLHGNNIVLVLISCQALYGFSFRISFHNLAKARYLPGLSRDD